jgi:hypothetical protein
MSEDAEEAEWQPMDAGSQIKSLAGGKIILVAPVDLHKTVVPLFCDLCKFPMKTREDGAAYKKYGCCDGCELRWRSTQEFLTEDFDLVKQTPEWKHYIEHRRKLSASLIKLK